MDVRPLGGRRYIAQSFWLGRGRPSDDVGRLVLLQDWAPTQQFLDELTRGLLLAGAGAFVLALAGGVAFSRRASRPLIDISQAAGDIAGGDWTRQVPVRGSAEAETLATAFNDMTRSLRDQAERLETAYQRFATVTQSARDAIISTDEQDVITFWNRSAEHIFGYTEAEVLGQSLLTLIAEPDRARYTAAKPAPIEHGLASGQAVEVIGIKKDGAAFPGEVSLAAVQAANGIALTAVVRDVSERRRVEEALRQRDEQLRHSQKMEAIGRLAGGIAHDFNNLLMAIQGYAELMLHGLPDGDPHRSEVEEILKASDRAAGLTRQLLAFSRRQVITQQPVPLDQLVDGTEKMLRRLIGEDVTLEMHVWPGLTPVLADRTQLEQILVNLVVNARDAMPEGGRYRNRAPERRARSGRRGGASGPRAGQLRGDGGERHRNGHGRGDGGAHLRALLHDQGERQGHGSGARDGLRHRAAERGRHRSPEPAGARNALLDLPAAGGQLRTAARTQAADGGRRLRNDPAGRG